jgi:acyl transferase domain-containing protein
LQSGDGATTNGASAEDIDVDAIRARCSEEVPVSAFYAALAERGLQYGPNFQAIQNVWRRDGEALGRIRLSEEQAVEAALYQAHPVLLDACLQVLGASVPVESELATGRGVYVPVGLQQICLHRPLPTQLWSHAQLGTTADADDTSGGPDSVVGDVRLYNEAGLLVAEVRGFRLQRLGGAVEAAMQAASQNQVTDAAKSERTAQAERAAAAPPAQESLRATNGVPANGKPAKQSATRQTVLAARPAERQALLEEYLGQHLARAMKVPVSKLDFHKPLEEQGFDSLMAIEVKYAVESELSIEIPVRNLIEKPTVASLAGQLSVLITGSEPVAVNSD